MRTRFADALLAAVWTMAGRATRSPRARRVAMRALQMHRVIVWTRAVRYWEREFSAEAGVPERRLLQHSGVEARR